MHHLDRLWPWLHDTQHNDNEYNDTQHKGLLCNIHQKMTPSITGTQYNNVLHYAESHCAECHYAEWHSGEFRYYECRHAECCDALTLPKNIKLIWIVKRKTLSLIENIAKLRP
jgi:hypothetical protein